MNGQPAEKPVPSLQQKIAEIAVKKIDSSLAIKEVMNFIGPKSKDE